MVADYRSCAAGRGILKKNSTALILLLRSGPSEFVPIEILGPLPKLECGLGYILEIKDKFSKITHAIPLRITSTGVIADASLENRIFAFRIPLYLPMDNGLQFEAKLFSDIAVMLGTRELFTTA